MTTTETAAPKPVIGETISLKAASERYGIPVRTLRTWVTVGSLPAFKVNGTLVRIRTADIEALFEDYR